MSWSQVKLGSIFEIARGGSPRPIDDYITDADDGLNWISIKDASNSGKYIYEAKLRIKPEGLSKTRMVNPGDFLLTNSMSFGRPYIMKTTGCIHDGWLVLSGDPERVDADYFYHLFGSDLLRRRFSSLAAGAVVKNLNIGLVEGVEVPLPPLSEQKRIAAILDKADAVRRKRQQVIQLAGDFLRAVFLDMFGDPVTNPKGWPGVGFDHYCTLNPKNQGLLDDVEVSFVPMQRVSSDSWNVDVCESRPYGDVKKGFTPFAEGDVLFAKITPCMENGKAGIARGLKNGFGYGSTEFHVLRPLDSDFAPFLYCLVHLNSFRDQAAASFSGAVGHKRVPKDFFTKFPLYKVPDVLLRDFSSVFKRVESELTVMGNSGLSFSDLFESLRFSAFSGRL